MVTSARTASRSSQSRPGARRLVVGCPERGARWVRTVTSPPRLLRDGRHDRAVVEELGQPRGRDGAGRRGPRRAYGLALDAVERLPDRADAVTGRPGAGAALADHHHHDVVLAVGRDPAGGLLAVDLG